MQAHINQVLVQIKRGAVLAATTEAIVHETDSGLSISQAWTEAAGSAFVEQVTLIGWCDIGSAVLSDAGALAALKVIHAVGPRWGDASARGKLANVTWEILQLAEDHALSSVTLPPISTGANGYPVENCAKIMLEQIIDFTFESLDHLSEIMVAVSTDEEEKAFYAAFQQEIDTLKDSDESDALDTPPS